MVRSKGLAVLAVKLGLTGPIKPYPNPVHLATSETDSAERRSETRQSSFFELPEQNLDGEWIQAQEGRPILGELVERLEKIGEHDSDGYLVRLEEPYPAFKREGEVEAESLAKFLDAFQISQTLDRGGVEPGDRIGVLKTGETFEGRNGTGYEFDVRYELQESSGEDA